MQLRRRVGPRVLVSTLVMTSCSSSSPSDVPPTELAIGTWGGERVGIVVDATNAHVHVACTKGDFPTPIEVDADLRINATGSYLLRAYPIAIGPSMPAVLAGVVRGDQLTFTISVSDTIENTLVVLGPATVTRGQEPMMGACPICAMPDIGAGTKRDPVPLWGRSRR